MLTLLLNGLGPFAGLIDDGHENTTTWQGPSGDDSTFETLELDSPDRIRVVLEFLALRDITRMLVTAWHEVHSFGQVFVRRNGADAGTTLRAYAWYITASTDGEMFGTSA
jgi:hypothetical protein